MDLNITPAAHNDSPKNAFLHLLLIITLYISVISFIALIFQYINAILPDPLNFYLTSIYDTIRLSSATLIVSVPIFLLSSSIIGKDIQTNNALRHSGIRKWLLYLTLLVSAITIIVYLTRLIYNFYGGELTLSFALKVLTVLVVTGSVFGYYLSDLRDLPFKISNKALAYIVSFVVLVSIIAGFFIVGSPFHQRQVRFDEERVSDLQSIQYQIVNYWQRKNTVPEQLNNLNDDISGYTIPKDPVSEQAYEYTKKSDLTFELCATFATEESPSTNNYYYSSPGFDLKNENWKHGIGKTCFERTIDPALYKLEK